MVPQIIQLAIYVAVFCFVAYGLTWVCARFGMPQWVLWICGGILLIVLLLFVSSQFTGGGAGQFHLFPHGN
jgi:Kef-type K+ transport system membrane component KefB